MKTQLDTKTLKTVNGGTLGLLGCGGISVGVGIGISTGKSGKGCNKGC